MTIHPTIRDLIEEIELFRERTEISASAFGAKSINDAKLIPDLHEGRTPSIKTIDRIRAFMSRENAA